MSTVSVVVKVGGSLYDLPDLGPRLRGWLGTLPPGGVLLVPGGGPAAEALRHLDRIHQLGEERSHWLALQALTVSAHFLAALMPDSRVVADVAEDADQRGGVMVLDAYRFARADEGRPGRLPHTWDVTSDSIAARAAILVGARELVLLKSTTIPPVVDWAEAARQGWVDRHFAEMVTASLSVRAVNLREWLPA